MRKRFADWLEKVSVGSLLVAAWHNQTMGYFVSAVALCASLAITRWSEKR